MSREEFLFFGTDASRLKYFDGKVSYQDTKHLDEAKGFKDFKLVIIIAVHFFVDATSIRFIDSKVGKRMLCIKFSS